MIELKNISLAFKIQSGTDVVMDSFNLKVSEGDFVCILGPSGCGKSTLLNVIAGFLAPYSGRLVLARTKLTLGFVFQDHNIFPWKTVRQNIAVGLRGGVSKRETSDRVNRVAKDVGLYESLDKYPSALSGGMKQRVGVARALIGSPDVILMDEPFAALDALTAESMRMLLVKLRKSYGTTTIFVTHNIDEAIQLGTRVIVLSHKPTRIMLDEQNANTPLKSNLDLRQRIHSAFESDRVDELI